MVVLLLACTVVLMVRRGRKKVALLHKHTALVSSSTKPGVTINMKDLKMNMALSTPIINNGLSINSVQEAEKLIDSQKGKANNIYGHMVVGEESEDSENSSVYHEPYKLLPSTKQEYGCLLKKDTLSSSKSGEYTDTFLSTAQKESSSNLRRGKKEYNSLSLWKQTKLFTKFEMKLGVAKGTFPKYVYGLIIKLGQKLFIESIPLARAALCSDFTSVNSFQEDVKFSSPSFYNLTPPPPPTSRPPPYEVQNFPTPTKTPPTNTPVENYYAATDIVKTERREQHFTPGKFTPIKIPDGPPRDGAAASVLEFPRHRLRIVEKLGEGGFGMKLRKL
ncbi:hypothetical protein C0J52_25991 [Blattella germanica]|nr:hypothetical protein C0J52_25991 [Blattella germanica]